MQNLYLKHQATLQSAEQASKQRHYWSVYPEIPSERVYGEGAKAKAQSEFEALLNRQFEVEHINEKQVIARTGGENSPFGFALNISYPSFSAETLLSQADIAQQQWRQIDVKSRLGLCMEMVEQLSKSSFLIGNAVMHTTGQPYVMAFQAGAPHALDRAIEAISYAAQAQTANLEQQQWQKSVGKNKAGETIIAKVDKRFIQRGLGIGVVIGCSTFPTWNSYPGLFASLATGNSVIVKPSANAILPLAIAVNIIRKTLIAFGLNPDVVQLAVPQTRNITTEILKDKRVKIIDYTGSNSFADWLEANCNDKQLYLEKAGVNVIVIESTDNYQGMLANIAFSLSLYSGQMCTAPQNIYIAKTGITTNEGNKTLVDVQNDLAAAINKLLVSPDRAEAVLGALHSQAIAQRITALTNQIAMPNENNAKSNHKLILASQSVQYADYPQALTASPLLIAVDDTDILCQEEHFGPIAFVVACQTSQSAVIAATQSITTKGALTASLYSVNKDFKQQATEQIIESGAPLSINFCANIYVNQSAAFSDFHGNSLTPSANTSLCDLSFVSRRFAWITVREMASNS